MPIKPIARAEPASVQRICVHIQRDRRNGKKALGTAKIARNRRSVPMQRGIQHGYADLGDVRLHYVTAGQGPAVIVLHGWPQTWFMWRDIIPGLAARYRVIAPDLRGLGDSSRPVGGYDKKTLADDVWRLVHGVLGERRVFVAGHDWGGPTAFALAAQHRDAVRGVAVFDAPVPGDGTPVMFNNRWHHGLHWELDFPEALTAGREELYLGFFYRNWGARRHRRRLRALDTGRTAQLGVAGIAGLLRRRSGLIDCVTRPAMQRDRVRSAITSASRGFQNPYGL